MEKQVEQKICRVRRISVVLAFIVKQIQRIEMEEQTKYFNTSHFEVMVKPSEITMTEPQETLTTQCSWDLSSEGKLPVSVKLPDGYALELEGAEIWNWWLGCDCHNRGCNLRIVQIQQEKRSTTSKVGRSENQSINSSTNRTSIESEEAQHLKALSNKFSKSKPKTSGSGAEPKTVPKQRKTC